MADVNVPITVSFPLGTPKEMLAKVDEMLALYFNLHISLVGGSGPETSVERGEVAARIVAHLLGWDEELRPHGEVPRPKLEFDREAFIKAWNGVPL